MNGLGHRIVLRIAGVLRTARHTVNSSSCWPRSSITASAEACHLPTKSWSGPISRACPKTDRPTLTMERRRQSSSGFGRLGPSEPRCSVNWSHHGIVRQNSARTCIAHEILHASSVHVTIGKQLVSLHFLEGSAVWYEKAGRVQGESGRSSVARRSNRPIDSLRESHCVSARSIDREQSSKMN